MSILSVSARVWLGVWINLSILVTRQTWVEKRNNPSQIWAEPQRNNPSLKRFRLLFFKASPINWCWPMTCFEAIVNMSCFEAAIRFIPKAHCTRSFSGWKFQWNVMYIASRTSFINSNFFIRGPLDSTLRSRVKLRLRTFNTRTLFRSRLASGVSNVRYTREKPLSQRVCQIGALPNTTSNSVRCWCSRCWKRLALLWIQDPAGNSKKSSGSVCSSITCPLMGACLCRWFQSGDYNTGLSPFFKVIRKLGFGVGESNWWSSWWSQQLVFGLWVLASSAVL